MRLMSDRESLAFVAIGALMVAVAQLAV